MSLTHALSLSRGPATAFVVVGLFWGTFAASVPVLKDQIGAGDAVFGTLLLATSIGLGLAMWGAPLLDRLLGAQSMRVATLFFGALFILPSLAQSPAMFAGALMLLGLSSGTLDVVMNARVSDLESLHGKSLMNANHGMFSVGYTISAVLTGYAREAGMPLIYVFVAMSVAVVILSFFMKGTTQPAAQDDGQTGTNILWPVLICGAIVLVAFMTEATVEAWSALHIERTLGGSPMDGALGPAMLGVTMTIGRFSGQVVTERYSENSVIIAASIISAIGAIGAAIAPTAPLAYLGFGVMGLGVSVIGPIGLAILGQLVPEHARVRAVSRAAVIGFAGFFIAPMVMGLISESHGLRIAFGCVAALVLLVLPLVKAIPAKS
ncbi:MFS transporter [Algirhabdus cladophorae]|uniref:MFS transporter n=1 Tax=Algirhabdus cladophorae TaxID=3377108 RepID=UPI003B845F68